MITSLFSLIREDITEKYQIDNLGVHLHNTGTTKYYTALATDYGDDAPKVAAYLIFTYSFDSTFVITGEDWLATKLSILEMVGLDVNDHASVLNFEKQSVKDFIIYLSNEVKDWRYNQTIIWKESCVILDQIATTMPDSKSKGGSKNIGDANKFSFETKRKIADLENEIKKTTKQPDRLKEVSDLNIENMSWERLLKEIREN